MADDKERPIIIKHIKKIAGGHHGGAWKVAYADFVTAMMAFFLLLWLLGATTDDQRKGIADYFDPIAVSASQSGSGEILGGKSPNEPGSQVSNERPSDISTTDTPGQRGNEAAPPVGKEEDAENVSDKIPKNPSLGQSGISGDQSGVENKGQTPAEQAALEKKGAELAAKKEQQQFEETKNGIVKAIQADPTLTGLAKNLIVENTPEGLRIQIIDTDGTPMFESGSTRISESMKKILNLVAVTIKPLTNKLSIRGHTDSSPYRGWQRDNWDLSADRANASRRQLINAGIPPDRIANVVGRADKDPLLPKDPQNPQNRRISIILMRDFPDAAKAATKAINVKDADAPASDAGANATTATSPAHTPTDPPAIPAK